MTIRFPFPAAAMSRRSADLDAIALPLFVPADRPERLPKALGAGADAVIADLEDAVAPRARRAARASLMELERVIAESACPVLLRVNAAGTVDHAADLALASALPLAGIVLPKAESIEEVARVARVTGRPVVALIETARGLAHARPLAEVSSRLAFGSIDFAADLGCAHARDALLLARLELVLASRLAGRPGPIDGVTAAVREPEAAEGDAAYAAGLGFAGKLLIHPAQIAPARRGFCPSAAETEWAARVVALGQGGAATLDGLMIDAPVRLRAEAILRRAGRAPAPETKTETGA